MNENEQFGQLLQDVPVNNNRAIVHPLFMTGGESIMETFQTDVVPTAGTIQNATTLNAARILGDTSETSDPDSLAPELRGYLGSVKDIIKIQSELGRVAPNFSCKWRYLR
jgi:hypothetical protein